MRPLTKVMLAAVALTLATAGLAFRPALAQDDCVPSPFNLCTGGRPSDQPPHNEPPHNEPPHDQPPANCTETLAQRQVMPGVLSLNLDSSCRRDVPLVFNVDGHPFNTVFNSAGHAEAVVPLFQATTHITWSDNTGAEQKLDVSFENYSDTVQIILIWDDPIDLDLRLVEPKGSFTADNAGNVYAAKPNTDFSNGYGVLARSDDGQAAGTHAEIYVLTKDRNPVVKGTLPRGFIAQKVDYVTRDAIRKDPFCDGGRLASPRFTIYRNVYGRTVPTNKYMFPALACDAIDESQNRLYRADPQVNLTPR